MANLDPPRKTLPYLYRIKFSRADIAGIDRVLAGCSHGMRREGWVRVDVRRSNRACFVRRTIVPPGQILLVQLVFGSIKLNCIYLFRTWAPQQRRFGMGWMTCPASRRWPSPSTHTTLSATASDPSSQTWALISSTSKCLMIFLKIGTVLFLFVILTELNVLSIVHKQCFSFL